MKYKAFTLIELMVTISIMALLAVTAVPAFSRISAVNQLDNAAEEVKQMILEAQSLAMNPISDMWPGGDSVFFKKDLNEEKSYIRYRKKDFSFVDKSFDLPNGISFTSNAAMTVGFTIPTGAIFLTDPQPVDNLFIFSIQSAKLNNNNIRYVKLDVNTGKISVTKTL